MKYVKILCIAALISCCLSANLMRKKNKDTCQKMPTIQTVLSLNTGDAADCTASLTSDFSTRDKIMDSDGKLSCPANNHFGPWSSTYPAVTIPKGCDATKWMQDRVLKIIDYIVKTKNFNYCHHHVGTWMPDAQYQTLLNICPAGGNGDPTAVEGFCSNAQPNNFKGIDCTTYTATVYNYGFGMYVVTNTGDQACGPKAPGVALNLNRDQQDKFLPGDIIYLKKDSAGAAMSHGIFWTGIKAIIDTPDKPDPSPFGLQNLLKNVPSCQLSSAQTCIKNLAGKPLYVISDSHWNGPNYRPFCGWYYNSYSHVRRIINPDNSLKGPIAGSFCNGQN